MSTSAFTDTVTDELDSGLCGGCGRFVLPVETLLLELSGQMLNDGKRSGETCHELDSLSNILYFIPVVILAVLGPNRPRAPRAQ